MKSAQGEQLGWRPLEITVVVVACLIVANHLFGSVVLLATNKYNAQLDLAGAQRMLSQRTLLLARAYAADPSRDIARQLTESLERMRIEYRVLRDGGAAPGAPSMYDGVKPVGGEAQPMISSFGERLEPYLGSIERVLSDRDAALPTLDEARAILADAHAIVQSLEKAAVTRNRQLVAIEIGLGIVETALILLVVFQFVRRLRKSSETVTDELRNRSKLLLNLYEQSPLMQYSVDAKWRLVRVNKAWLDTMGYERAEVIGQSSRLFLCPETFDDRVKDHVGLMGRSDERAEIQNFQVDLITKGNERRHCVVAMRLHRKSDGEFMGADILCMDESERIRSERDLMNANAALAESFRNMPVALFRCSLDGTIREANAAFLREFGAHSLRDLDRGPIERIVQDAIKKMTEQNVPMVQGVPVGVAQSNGSTASFLVSLRHVPVRDDAEVEIEGALINVTELERVKTLVKRSRRRFQELYDSTPVMLYSIDARGNVEDINDYMLKRIGRARHDVIGSNGSDLVVDDDREVATVAMRETVVRGKRLTYDCEIGVAGGGSIAARLTAVPRLRADGSYNGAHLCVLDMSEVEAATEERDRLAEELQTAQKLEAVGQLAAGIAHEINTPAQYVTDNLQFIAGAVTELLESALQRKAQHEGDTAVDGSVDLDFLSAELPPALGEAEGGMRQIKNIVQAMKDFSHPGGLEKESTDINRLVESVVTVTRNEWKYVANVDTQLDAALPAVRCSGSEINQVLLNMIVNAAHAMKQGDPEEGRIVVSTEHDGTHVVIRIRDNGSGIPADVLPNIFNPFFTTKEVGKGTGQGLAIAHRIVGEHGGTIQVDSQVGDGTTFTIRLPIEAEANAA